MSVTLSSPCLSPLGLLLRASSGVALALAVLLWAGCPASEVCQSNSDCGSGQACVASKCVAADGGDGGGETTPGETGADGEPTTEGGNEGSTVEPPPLDASWGEGTVPPPETLQDGQTPGSGGKRKIGESCNPGLTALPIDRCEDGSLCAAPDLGPVGICQKSCKADGNDCGSGEACGPVRAIETGALLGHACGPEVKPGFSCTDGLPCQKGHVCVRYDQPERGICQQVCEKRADCGTGWCASGKGLGGDVSACAKLVDKAGEPCPNGSICGSNLTCEGEGARRVCLQQNCTAQAPCPQGSACTPILDDKGQPLYSACFPIAAEFELCHGANRCDKGLVCANFNGTPDTKACVKDCTSDDKLCKTNEVCTTVTGNTKGCIKVVPEGGLCEGPAQCDQGLTCLATKGGAPRFCHKDCSNDASICQAPASCVAITPALSLCAATCDPNAPACTNQAFSCVALSNGGACLPTGPADPGQAKVGDVCDLSAAAAAASRCTPGLACVALKEGHRCVQPCDPASPSCPSGQACLRDHQTRRDLCGAGGTAGQACDVATGKLCQAGLRCVHQGYSSVGTCAPLPDGKAGDWCLDGPLSCGTGLACAGDPTVPFRWICRQSCDPNAGNPGCAAKQACVTLVDGGACFDTCQSPQDSCANQTHSCQSLQGKQICM